MKEAPTRNGIAISPYEFWLPESHVKEKNNHHGHYYARMFGKTAVHQCLRDLESKQWMMNVDVHEWWHNNYGPGQFPAEERAAKEVIDAYDRGERFKIYNKRCHWYDYKEIPKDLVDGFVAKYSLIRVFDMAAD